MNTREYCTTVGHELEGWRERLAHVTDQIDHTPSIDKYKLTPQIEGLHILLTELDDRIVELEKECVMYAGFGGDKEMMRCEGGDIINPVKETEGVVYDYDFGG